MHKAFPLPVMEFPLPEEVPTASEESSHCQKKRDATAEIPPKRSSTSEASTMSQAAIRKLVADNVATALETQTVTMAEADNPIRNTTPREIPIAKIGNYKEFINYKPLYFNGMEGVIKLIN
nr:hypothetical protein [Tanacetum cinerariifolium]